MLVNMVNIEWKNLRGTPENLEVYQHQQGIYQVTAFVLRQKQVEGVQV